MNYGTKTLTKAQKQMREVKIILKGLKQTLGDKLWSVSYSIWKNEIRGLWIHDNRKGEGIGVHIDGDGVYWFLRMLLVVRPMITSKYGRFTYKNLWEIGNCWSMGQSKIAYGEQGWTGEKMLETDEKSYHPYLTYKLPREVIITILDMLQDSVGRVSWGVGEDSEGCVYNSLSCKPIPDTGLWTGNDKTSNAA